MFPRWKKKPHTPFNERFIGYQSHIAYIVAAIFALLYLAVFDTFKAAEQSAELARASVDDGYQTRLIQRYTAQEDQGPEQPPEQAPETQNPFAEERPKATVKEWVIGSAEHCEKYPLDRGCPPYQGNRKEQQQAPQAQPKPAPKPAIKPAPKPQLYFVYHAPSYCEKTPFRDGCPIGFDPTSFTTHADLITYCKANPSKAACKAYCKTKRFDEACR